MTLQQLKYALEVANCRSISQAAQNLYISQPSLSTAVHELEAETGVTIFARTSRGVLVTPEGEELLSYARQVVQQAELLEERYVRHTGKRKRFAVSTQHYSFTARAFVELVKDQREPEYEFTLREGRTWDTIQDVRTMRSELGVIYLSDSNEAVITRLLRESGLSFTPLFEARPHIFIGRHHPLASRDRVSLEDLAGLPYLSYDQGDRSAQSFAEELLPTADHPRSIRVTDKSAIIDLMTGTDGYTISSGICPSYLRGEEIVSIPLTVDEEVRIGVIMRRDARLSELAVRYMNLLRDTVGAMQQEG